MKRFRVQETSSFSLALCGEDGAMQRCAYLGGHVLLLTQQLGERGFPEAKAFAPLDLDGFREPEGFTAWAAGAKGQALQRVAQLRGLQPGL